MDGGLMSQEEIKFYNMRWEHDSCWLHDSPFKSVGNVLHWITVYVGLTVADTVQVGNYKVTYWGKNLASFEFDENRKMPIFNIQKTDDTHIDGVCNILIKSQMLYLNMLEVYEFRDKMSIEEFGYINPDLIKHDCEFLQNLNIGFKKIGRVHDWRKYINNHLILNWNTLSLKEKIIAYIPALKQADNEEWD